MTSGLERSVAAILRAQHAEGAFVASPDFAQYRYCWLRDGSFTAYSLDRAGEVGAAERFHMWCAAAVSGVAGLISRAIERKAAGEPIERSAMPPARFSLEGTAVNDDWPNFQVDGYGTWLWSLHQHLQKVDEQSLPAELLPAVRSTAAYLSEFGTTPCFDVWEEDGASVHTSTLGCVYAGLRAAAAMLGEAELEHRAAQVRELLLGQARATGRFRKSDRSPSVDASLLWLCEPFHVVDPDDPFYNETVREISARLVFEGGARRYPEDTYYGGGSWPVLTASLGWYYASAGDRAAATRCRDWVAAHFDEKGRLAEQFGGEKRDPAHYSQWVDRWGPPAADLVWSHAMYVVLEFELDAYARATGPTKPSSNASSITTSSPN